MFNPALQFGRNVALHAVALEAVAGVPRTSVVVTMASIRCRAIKFLIFLILKNMEVIIKYPNSTYNHSLQ
jgi:hypothetical protein